MADTTTYIHALQRTGRRDTENVTLKINAAATYGTAVKAAG
jgi:hypothetical protein